MIWLLACVQVHVETGSQDIQGTLGHAAVYLPSGNVTVGASPDADAHFQWISRYDADPPNVTVTAENGVVTSQVECLQNAVCQVDMVVGLPPELSLESDILTGDISVSDLSGDVRVSTSTGNLQFSGLTGVVTSSVETGDITGTDLGCPGFHGGGTTGDRQIEFTAVPLSVELNAAVGDVDLGVPAGPYAVTTTDQTGTVSVTGLEDDPTGTYTIDVVVGSGNIHIVGT